MLVLESWTVYGKIYEIITTDYLNSEIQTKSVYTEGYLRISLVKKQ